MTFQMVTKQSDIRREAAADGGSLAKALNLIAVLADDVQSLNENVQGQFAEGGGSGARDQVQAKTAPYTILPADSGTTFTNAGAAGAPATRQLALPPIIVGLRYPFVCVNASGMQVKAEVGDTIRVGGTVSGSGGTATLNDIGTALTLLAVSPSEWVAVASVGLADVV